MDLELIPFLIPGMSLMKSICFTHVLFDKSCFLEVRMPIQLENSKERRNPQFFKFSNSIVGEKGLF